MYKLCFIGGHFTTAYAVIQEILETKNRIKSSDIIFFGRKFEAGHLSPEFESINALGVDFINVFSVKFNRFFTFKNLISLLLLPVVVVNSLLLLLKYQPKIIVGFGGNLSLPVCLAAKILSKIIIIHEATVRGGFSNKIINHFANKSLISFTSSQPFFKKPVLTGCPMRREILNAEKINCQIPILYICGGHLGSQAINKSVFPLIARLVQSYYVVHQTGRKDFSRALELKKTLPVAIRMKYEAADFFNLDLHAKYLANASLIIARAGINTVCEIIFHQRKTIFVPLPFAQHNEQYENACLAVSAGIAVILEQKKLNPESLMKEINHCKNREMVIFDIRYQDQLKNASSRVADEILSFL